MLTGTDTTLGTHNLLSLAISAPHMRKFVFCSSVAAAHNTGTPTILEQIPPSEKCAPPMGYAQSKWVAEHLCGRAFEGPLRGQVVIARCGQLCGDTVNGVWNETEGWPLLVASCKYTGCLPILDEVRGASIQVLWLVDPSSSILRGSPSTSLHMPLWRSGRARAARIM